MTPTEKSPLQDESRKSLAGKSGSGGSGLPVFMYHHVGPHPPGCWEGLSITPEIFARQIRWLALCGFHTIRTTDLLAWIREAKPLPKRPLLLTFDDAYADSAKYALPVLKRYGFSGVTFVVTTTLGKTNAWDEAVGLPSLEIMTADEIRHWAKEGMEFGAHTRTHPDLTLVSAEKLEDELRGSSADLSELLGTRVLSFAYPYGHHNDAAREAARKVFDLSFTADEGLNTMETDAQGLLRVVVLPQDPLIKLTWRARYGFDPIERAQGHCRMWYQKWISGRLHPLVYKAFLGAPKESSSPPPDEH